MTNMVADMFKDTLGKDDPNFIGLQNPGGTRASLLDKDITYCLLYTSPSPRDS